MEIDSTTNAVKKQYELREAYAGSWKEDNHFQYIWHELGIEGSSMTLEETRMIVETANAVKKQYELRQAYGGFWEEDNI